MCIFLYYFTTVLQKTSPEEDEEQEDDMNDIEQRNHMLEQLLTVLNSAAAVGLGPDPGDLGKQYKETAQQITRLHGSNMGLRKGWVTVRSYCILFWHFYTQNKTLYKILKNKK